MDCAAPLTVATALDGLAAPEALTGVSAVLEAAATAESTWLELEGSDGCGTSAVDVEDGSCGLCKPFCVGLGVLRLVDKLMMSFPCTTRLSFDFFRSLVSISVAQKQ